MIPRTLLIFLAAAVLLLVVVARSRSPRRSMYFYLVFTALSAAALALCRRVGIGAPVEPLLVILGCGSLVMAAGTIFSRADEEAASASKRSKVSETPPAAGTAYIAAEFPQQNHAPLQREISALAARGFAPTVFSLRAVRAESLAPSARLFMERTVAARAFFSAALLGANLRWALAHPVLYFGALGGLLRRCSADLPYMFRALAVFPRAAYFADVARREGVTHLHAHAADLPADCAMVAAHLTGATWSTTARDTDVFAPNPSLPHKLREARFVVATTAYNVRYLSGMVPRGERAAIHLNYDGVDLSRAAYEPRLDPPETPGEFRILAVGRLVERKGFPFLFDAIRRLKERGYAPRLRVLGEGPLRRDLEKLAEVYGIEGEVNLMGEATHARVLRDMRRADCLVAPSIVARDGERDSVSGAVVEAMATGLPVIASRVAGIPEFIVDGETGLLVRPGDGDDIADAVEKLLSPIFDRTGIVEVARAHVEKNFSIAKSTATLLKLLTDDSRKARREQKESLVHSRSA